MKAYRVGAPAEMPDNTEEIVDHLLKIGLIDEAEELTTSAIDYVQTHDYYSLLTGLGHLAIALDKDG